MIKLDDNLLQELGLGTLQADDKKKMLAHIYETLEMRVGMELAKQMTDAQLAEFEEFITRNDEAGALRWLETNFPNYKDVVAAEFEKLKAEVKQVAPQIIASSQQQLASQAVPPQQPYQQQYAQPQPQYAQPVAPQPPQGMPMPGQPQQPYYQQPAPQQQPQPQQYPQQPQQPQYAQPPYPPAQPGQAQQPPMPGQPYPANPPAPNRNDYDLAG